jgi:hypothetical protein
MIEHFNPLIFWLVSVILMLNAAGIPAFIFCSFHPHIPFVLYWFLFFAEYFLLFIIFVFFRYGYIFLFGFSAGQIILFLISIMDTNLNKK